jgi:sialate O-acetylesterase
MKCVVPLLFLAGALRAEVVLPPIFSDHAVLQKSDVVPVWGKARPGEKIQVSLDRVSATAEAGSDGKWMARLNLADLGPGPFELTVTGENTLTVRDVLVGEVWACTGQSNMAFPLSAFPAVVREELPVSANPQIRQFLVANKPSREPLDEAQGKWTVASPETAGAFSATAYFFGKQLQKELGAPVGLINDSVGGTVIETWMSREALAADPELKAGSEKARTDRLAADEYAEKLLAWQKQFGREDQRAAPPESFADPKIDTTDWKPVTLPSTFASTGLPGSGAIWLRRIIPAPSAPDVAPGKGIDLYLGAIRGENEVYWNGRKIGQSTTMAADRRYGIRHNFVLAGDNVLAVRIFNPSGDAGILPGRERFQANHFALKGEWQAKAEFELPPMDSAAQTAMPPRPATPIEPQNVASYLYNGMIHPIVPYAIRGFIWYQGEGNWQRGFQYRTAFPLLIKDWRAKWGRGDLPFYFCQLANYMGHNPKPEESPYAEVREAQTMTLSVPNTGQAILIDIGEEKNIHPADKKSVGDRLARLALAGTYEKKVVASGPAFESLAIEGAKIRLQFTHIDGGLVARKLPDTYQPLSTDPQTVPLVRNSPLGELEGFAICGEDREWKWATAKIDGDSVVVWSDEVPHPVAVRYAWAQNPFCNLYNGAGLPAGPFRTDDFPLASQKARY